jgi:hypothetical protein
MTDNPAGPTAWLGDPVDETATVDELRWCACIDAMTAKVFVRRRLRKLRAATN